MLKVGPSRSSIDGTAWDHKGKSEIAKIIISQSETDINFINFLYVEDGGKKLVLSEKIGVDTGGTLSLDTITLDYPSEVITGLNGKYEASKYSQRLRSVTFVTNKHKHGPFEIISLADISNSKDIEFKYDVGCNQFGGFFGTFTSGGIESIGIYLKPLEKLTVKDQGPSPSLSGFGGFGNNYL